MPPKPKARPETATAPATTPAEPAKAGAAPAIKAPVPATIAPSGTPAGDGLIANIERILQRDGATEGAPDQSGVGLAVPADPALAGSAPLPLPPSAGSGGIVIVDPTLPPADVGGPPPRLLPPGNIPLPPAGPSQ
jgi:hypothetical protein